MCLQHPRTLCAIHHAAAGAAAAAVFRRVYSLLLLCTRLVTHDR